MTVHLCHHRLCRLFAPEAAIRLRTSSLFPAVPLRFGERWNILARVLGPALLWGFFFASPWPGAAQGLEGFTGDSDETVEIYADDGIEWLQEKKVYIARGNASAIRGEITVNADVLTAHYREGEQGGTDIWRLDADGNVQIIDPSSTTYADRGIYDIPKGILVLTGRDLRMISGNDIVTARDSLEYWLHRNMAVARGAARAKGEGREIKADILTAYFREVPEGGTKIHRVEAFGNVSITTPTETATGDRGVYNIETGIASLFGSVKIHRGKDQLSGEYGEVNLNTGVSRILNAAPGSETKGRVRAVFSPAKKTVIESQGENKENPASQ